MNTARIPTTPIKKERLAGLQRLPPRDHQGFRSWLRILRHPGANEANIIWKIDSPEFPKGTWLELSFTASADPPELAERVAEFHAFFLKME